VRLGEFLMTIGGIALGAGPAGVAGAVLATRITGAGAMRVHLWRLSPWLRLGFREATLGHLRRLLGPAFAFMGFPLGHALRIQGIIMAVGLLLGPTGVVTFATTGTLTNVAFQFMSIIHLSVWPELSTAFGAGDLGLGRALHRRAVQAALWTSLAAAAGLFFLGQPAYHLWVRDGVVLDRALFCCLLVGIVANSLWYTSSVVPMAVNRHQGTALRYVAGAGLAVLLALLLVPCWGLPGAGIALLAIDSVMLLHVLPRSLALLQDRGADFIPAVGRPPDFVLRWGTRAAHAVLRRLSPSTGREAAPVLDASAAGVNEAAAHRASPQPCTAPRCDP
jgi:O-antigen/teichoic acid export membrane protein